MPVFACFVALLSDFGQTPVAADYAEGQKIYSLRKGIDRAQKDARVVVGNWFDGERVQVVEEIDFLTPGVLSRWLGFQEAAGTPKAKVDSAWTQFSQQFNGRTMALIRLTRLGTVDVIDGEVENRATIDALDQVQISMREVGHEWQDVPFRMVQDVQGRQPNEVLRDTWDEVLAKFTAWPSKPSAYDLVSEIRWGQNRRVSLLAEVPKLTPKSHCEVKIIEKDRTRTITFIYPKS